ncbi:MAG: hypothetical protein MPJ78_20055, partial [Hyphomicrobiaceae bacterium]|nr:hypothetical protein [Hyphomicrobiaceae bacterium]
MSAAKAEAKNVTYFTYIPATGGIFMYKGPDILSGKLDMPPVGLAPPMVPGTAGSGIRASGLIGFDTDNPVPVVDTLGKHAEQHQIDADAQAEIDRCQEIMLLPALMEFATYPSLHSAFSEVPL